MKFVICCTPGLPMRPFFSSLLSRRRSIASSSSSCSLSLQCPQFWVWSGKKGMRRRDTEKKGRKKKSTFSPFFPLSSLPSSCSSCRHTKGVRNGGGGGVRWGGVGWGRESRLRKTVIGSHSSSSSSSSFAREKRGGKRRRENKELFRTTCPKCGDFVSFWGGGECWRGKRKRS